MPSNFLLAAYWLIPHLLLFCLLLLHRSIYLSVMMTKDTPFFIDMPSDSSPISYFRRSFLALFLLFSQTVARSRAIDFFEWFTWKSPFVNRISIHISMILKAVKKSVEEPTLGVLELFLCPKIEDEDVKHDHFSRLEFFFPL